MSLRVTFAVLLAFGGVMLMGCSPVNFGMDDKAAAMKQEVLDNVDDGTKDDGNADSDGDGTPNYEDKDDDDDGIPDDKDDDDDGDGVKDNETIYDDENNGDLTLPTVHLCSDAQSEKIQSNVMTAKTLKLEVILSRGSKVVCTGGTTDQVRAALKKRSVHLVNCTLVDGSYSIKVTDEKGNNLVTKSMIRVEGGKITENETEVLMDSNPLRKSGESYAGMLDYRGTECDELASPLYVDLRRSSTDTDVLSSPKDGVQFDVLGANNTPAYSKSQISWFKNGKFGLLALPDSQGRVSNIDQLFGDNTKGPDGKFSANGFTALAKHDSNGDKRIDKKDAIFSKLRLWIDSNRDGEAEKSELLQLGEKDIVSIDLDYDPNYSERDKYGNVIKYKSAVELSNGKFKSIFDVWFKLN